MSVPWGLCSCGVGRLGESAASPVLALTWWPARRWRRQRIKPSWVSLLTPRPGGGGWVGVGRPGPAGPVGPGAPAVCGSRHLQKAGSSGAGTAVGGGMPPRLQTHKYRSRSGGGRRACGQVAPRRVSRGPGGRPHPAAPAPGLQADGAAQLCPGRSWGTGGPTGAGGEGPGRRGMGIQVQNWGRQVEVAWRCGSQRQGEILERRQRG